MSVKIMSMVFDRYPNGGGEMVLALALADHAHDDGTHIFPSISSLATKTRQSERAVQYQLRRMEDCGWLQLVAFEGGGRGRAREYQINPLWIKGADFSFAEKGANEDQKGCKSEQERVQAGTEKGATAIAPESSLEPSEEPSKNQARFRADRAPLPSCVPPAAWANWCLHRKEKRQALTERSVREQLEFLQDRAAIGESPEEIIKQAIRGGWSGLFPLKRGADAQAQRRADAQRAVDEFAEESGDLFP